MNVGPSVCDVNRRRANCAPVWYSQAAMVISGNHRRGLTATDRSAPGRSAARERILATAYELFCQEGIRAVGIDRIIEQAGVAKMTMYRHFGSKEDLVLAVLDRREQLWTQEWLVAEVTSRNLSPQASLIAIFDVFDGWFRRRTFEGCLFVNALIEIADAKSPIHKACCAQLENIRSFIGQLATDAGITDPRSFAREWHILMKGSIVAAGEGDVAAARRAQHLGRLLLANVLPFQAPAP